MVEQNRRTSHRSNGLIIWILFLLFLPNTLAQDPYAELTDFISTKQSEFQKRFKNAENETQKSVIRKDAREYLFKMLTEKILPCWCWYGTPWSLNGTTRIPGKGSIACGYFIVNTLKDLGFKIPSSMACQPSENIIKNLVEKSKIKRFVNSSPMEKIEKWILENGDGVYIVGLDIHVDFIISKESKFSFCHSSYYDPPMRVVNQSITQRSPLTDSKYRVIGKILEGDMLEKWLTGGSFLLAHDSFHRE